jgi:hypothetical protein
VAVARNLGDDRTRPGALSETVVRQVIDSASRCWRSTPCTDPRFAGAESIVASHIVSILCVPLVIRERLAGAIYVDHLRSQHLFGERDLDFLVAFADQAALAIDNARLYGELEAHRQRLKEENESLRREILSNRHLGSLIGKSRAIEQLKDTLERVAQSSSTVLVRGESGTGKGLVARILHSVSPRREGPFIAFNCAALPETLVESELFGHEKGSFTGAVGSEAGALRARPQGHHLPRRDRQGVALGAGQAAARGRGPGVRARRRHPHPQERRAGRGGDQPQPRGGDRQRRVPRGPLLPAQHHPHRAAAAARAPRGHPLPGRALPRQDQPRPRPASARRSIPR